MESVLQWLQSLPLWALYSSMGALAAVENIFPPIPADTIVAIGSFLAARGQGTAMAAFLVTWLGNVLGAMLVYAAGRHFGAGFLDKWLQRAHADVGQEARLIRLYQQYGLAALALSRFIPGVRAIVPPFAGALRLPFVRVLLVVAVPSGLWYGLITYVAFRIGTNLEQVIDLITSAQGWVLGVAIVILAPIVLLFLRGRRAARSGKKGPGDSGDPSDPSEPTGEGEVS
jgi:membrane protein DedA with SNARE-associated domain